MTPATRSATKCSCGAELADAFVCTRCIEHYADQLGDLPALLNEALTTLARQDRITRRNGGRSAEKPLPFSWDASVAIDTAHNTLQSWIVEIEPSNTGLPPTARVGFLLRHSAWAAANPLGPQLIDEISYLATMLRRTVDLPMQRWFAGLCSSQATHDSHDANDCAEPLYGRFGAQHIRCTACGAAYTATERREWLIKEVQDALLPLRITWAALGTLAGNRPPWNVVRRWPDRRLPARGLSLSGEELFRVGDVLDLVHTYPARTRRHNPLLV